MNAEQLQILRLRWCAIERELTDLADGRTTPHVDPAERERELREEQDEIEFELASGHLDCGLDERCGP